MSKTDFKFIFSHHVHSHDYGVLAELSIGYKLNSQFSTVFKDQLGDIFLLKVGGHIRNILKCMNSFKLQILVFTLSISKKWGSGALLEQISRKAFVRKCVQLFLLRSHQLTLSEESRWIWRNFYTRRDDFALVKQYQNLHLSRKLGIYFFIN